MLVVGGVIAIYRLLHPIFPSDMFCRNHEGVSWFMTYLTEENPEIRNGDSKTAKAGFSALQATFPHTE